MCSAARQWQNENVQAQAALRGCVKGECLEYQRCRCRHGRSIQTIDGNQVPVENKIDRKGRSVNHGAGILFT